MDWMKSNPSLEQLIIMILKKFYQMDLPVFSWKEDFWKKFGVFEREALGKSWSLWKNKKDF